MGIYEQIIEQNKEFIDSTWEKLDRKLRVVAPRNREIIPYSTKEDGRYRETIPEGWTNGFWSGLLWLMYAGTGEEVYKDVAIRGEEMLNVILEDFDNLHHDVGFMWHISSGARYRLTGDKKAKSINMYAAASLASRYNMATGVIRAFIEPEREKKVIVDSMMNIQQLFWASEEAKDPRFAMIAMSHADTTMKNHIRPDGSVNHVLDYDIHTGEFLGVANGQGAGFHESSWTRGQAWALYGYALTYLHSGKQEYLDTAKRVAHYFMACVSQTGYVPQYDFRQMPDCKDIDTSAGAIAACGLIELAKLVPEYEKAIYLRAAIEIMKALEKDYCDWSLETDAVLQGVAEGPKRLNVTLIFGEYFFTEAIYKLKGFEPMFW